MKKRIILAFILLVCGPPFSLRAQQPDAEGSLVNWLTLEEALAKNKVQPKPILLDFYTSWCGWCKHMMKTTYADPGLAQYINTYFYAAKFNAEGKDTIEYLGKKYRPTSEAPRATHELTLALLNNQLMYPTTLFLNNFDTVKKEFGVNMLASGYLDRLKIEPLLVYNVENVFRSSSYDDFNASYQKAFYDSTNDAASARVKWIQPGKAFSESSPRKKKTLVFIHTDWCNSCKVMQRTTFSDSSVAAYLDEKFDLVALDAQFADTLKFKDHLFVNARTSQAPFHQLAVALSRNNLVLPALVVMDEDMNPVDVINQYINPKFLTDIAHFYGEDIYKKKSWREFIDDKEKDFSKNPPPPKADSKK